MSNNEMSAYHVLTHLILTTTQSGRYSYFPHFTDKVRLNDYRTNIVTQTEVYFQLFIDITKSMNVSSHDLT